MRYRPATDEDVAAIRRVAEASWESDYPAIVSRETATEAVEQWYDEATIREATADPLATVLVAVGDEVVGFSHAALSTEDWTGNVLRLYVAPDHRGEGVGSELLDRTVDTLEAAGAERIRTFVLADNDQGNAFYRAAGFERVDTGRTRIGDKSFEEHVYAHDPGE